MPTGYTADIAKGITFRQYALRCARAFGALITMRDDPNDAQIPDRFETAPFYQNSLDEALIELVKWQSMSNEYAEQASAKAFDEAETARFVRIAECNALRDKYMSMLAQVNSWEAPTPNHQNFHEFMRSQIEQSIEWDCDGRHLEAPTLRVNGADYRTFRILEARRSVAYSEKALAEENERIASRNAWIDELRKSLRPFI